ncbi:Inosine/uridine-preferring nucleoside hydrolase domain-containing protein [Stachybotrys elegans]|uniref:Inosine/uridine-preferring nucleoside hydrolase domain-containing protein n=1 Tax=Stachybotrys elegans TaxID=80388 RepID=A0A8K0WJQ6_9HYPO|nr:Inosine/uridine-preferring nucleoside hydrolase domain-containing protein [Stachybotrys elegans]
MMRLLPLLPIVSFCFVGAAAHAENNTTVGVKVIIDTDFNTIGDDGQALAMAAQMHASRGIHLLGLTIVTGNQWLHQGVSDGLKAVERVGLERQVGVYVGAEMPFLHDFSSFQLERRLFGNATAYVGAYRSPPGPLVPPPDGFATHTLPQTQHAVDFIIESVHRHPGQVTLLAIGPLTNVALAMRKDPSIVPLIKQIVIMGGQIYAPGNSYIGAGETNWWFDPEAARVVLRANVSRKIVPLDVTNTVVMTEELYDTIADHQPATPITRLFAGIERWSYVYDTVALASLYDPSLDLDVRDLYVDVSCDFSTTYGKGLAWNENPYPGLDVYSVSSVVFRVDNNRFFDLYTDLLTRSVPVMRA